MLGRFDHSPVFPSATEKRGLSAFCVGSGSPRVVTSNLVIRFLSALWSLVNILQMAFLFMSMTGSLETYRRPSIGRPAVLRPKDAKALLDQLTTERRSF
jgi:hypothetical protein